MQEREAQRQIVENNELNCQRFTIGLKAVGIAIIIGSWSVSTTAGFLTTGILDSALFPTTKEKARQLRKDRIDEAYAKRYGGW